MKRFDQIAVLLNSWGRGLYQNGLIREQMFSLKENAFV